jgi:beta propeller repeat protein
MRRSTMQQALLPAVGAVALVCFAILTGPASARPAAQIGGAALNGAPLPAPQPTATPTPLGPPPAAGPIATGPGDQQEPVIDGNYVVWEDNVGGDWDLSAYDLSNGRTFPVYHGAADQRLPAISGPLVVWQDNRNGDWDIYGARLSGDQAGAPFAIATGPGNQTTPAVSGNTVVWQNQTATGWQIMSLNLTGGSPRMLSDVGTTNENPAIDGALVVWQSTTPTQTLQSRVGAASWDILGYNLGNDNHLTVANTPADETNPAISGNVVVWQTYQSPPAAPQSAPLGVGRWSVEGADVTGGAVFTVTDGPGDQINPAISGSEIVYEDVQPASAAEAPGVIPHSTVLSRKLGSAGPQRLSYADANAGRPHTYRGRTVWKQRSRAFDFDVWGNVCTVSFTDVTATDYFYTPVQALTCSGAISGYSDHTFRPYTNTTRGQLAKIVVIAANWPLDLSNGPHFNDVPGSNPFYNYIETAYNRGIISGYADGSFRWGANVTRGQLSKIIVGAKGWGIDTSGGPHFNDVPATNAFYGFVETAFHRGIVSGYADGSFRLGADATRGQIAKIVDAAVRQP